MFLLIVAMTFILVACGNKDDSIKYTVDVEELDPRVYPDDYPLIAFSDFESAFEDLKEANANIKLNTYKDIVNIFGLDGAYYKNCDMDYQGKTYKYYGWYADNDVSILITFIAEGNLLRYYAYTTSGIF